MSGKKLLIVIPCYNEEEALPSTLKRMETLMNKMLGEKLIDKTAGLCSSTTAAPTIHGRY